MDALDTGFSEVWEARVFAIVIILHERGLFTWSAWTKALHVEIRNAQKMGDPDNGETYYRHWTQALEQLITGNGIATTTDLDIYSRAWGRTIERTPHGQPLELSPQDFIHPSDSTSVSTRVDPEEGEQD